MATTLLLADDSPTIGKILQMALQSEPYQIRSVLTADEALAELRKAPPVMFLCDLNLPAKSGYEFARLIRKDSKLRDIRVVLLASAFEPVDDAQFAECGADGLVKKPFDPAELRQKLRQILEGPPKFAEGARVTGSLSGFMVSDPHDSTRTNLTIGGVSASASTDTSSDILRGLSPEGGPSQTSSGPVEGLLGTGNDAADGGSADAILAGLLAGNAAPSAPPAAPGEGLALSPGSDEPPTFTKTVMETQLNEDFRPDRTVAIDLNAMGLGETGGNTGEVLDLSGSFGTGTTATPPGGITSPIDLVTQVGTRTIPETPPPPPADPSLSANAQALAAFFEAEITASTPQPPAAAAAPAAPVVPKPAAAAPAPAPAKPASPAAPADDAFDASLDSIDWGSGPADAKLNEWSHAQQPAPSKPVPTAPAAPAPAPMAAAPAPKSDDRPPPFAPPKKSSSGFMSRPGAAADNLMFDTGGSSFRFSEDYVNRITKSFTGGAEDHVPASAAPAMFPSASDDRAPSAPTTGGGAWSDAETAKIEKIVREEVQMVVREVAEKIAWEVIPELAENLIKKELERVLKEMGQ